MTPEENEFYLDLYKAYAEAKMSKRCKRIQVADKFNNSDKDMLHEFRCKMKRFHYPQEIIDKYDEEKQTDIRNYYNQNYRPFGMTAEEQVFLKELMKALRQRNNGQFFSVTRSKNERVSFI